MYPDWGEAPTYLNDNWNVFSGHWKAEFLIMGLITIGAIYFMIHFRTIGWTVVSLGQIIILTMYPLMLGGYHNTPLEINEAVNKMVVVIFVLGNIIFLAGLFLVYMNEQKIPKWLQILAMVLSALGCLVFLGAYLDIYGWKKALMAGPLVNVLYLINAYLGVRIDN
jgi:hypothetical protein